LLFYFPFFAYLVSAVPSKPLVSLLHGLLILKDIAQLQKGPFEASTLVCSFSLPSELLFVVTPLAFGQF
jgi:hypothetical protein